MLTRRGRMLLIVGAASLVTGLVLGREDLYAIAGAAIALPLFARWWVRRADVQLVATRHVRPVPLHVGLPGAVELQVRNAGSRRTPVLWVRDPLGASGVGRAILLPPLEPGATTEAVYRFPTNRRGVYSIGPLRATVSDPFAVATVVSFPAREIQVTVLPHVDDIALVPESTRTDRMAGSGRPLPLGAGEEFFALRPYQVGDDLRRVHWRSTARVGELMIRQDELPRQHRTAVVLDVRRSAHTADSLEQAVSAAASVATACWRAGSTVRLLTTAGYDSGTTSAMGHVDDVMEHLATLKATPHDRLANVVAGLRRTGGGGGLVIITGTATDADGRVLSRLLGRFGTVTIVLFGDAPAPPERGRPWLGGTVVRVPAGATFAEAWDGVMRHGPAASGPRTGTDDAPS